MRPLDNVSRSSAADPDATACTRALRADARHRTVDEARIIEQLLVFGFAFEIRTGAREQTRRDAASALQRWIELGLPWVSARGGGRLFDPVEVMNFMRGAGHAGRDGFWTQRLVATSRKNVLSWHLPETTAGAPCLSALPAQRFAVKFRRAFDLESPVESPPRRLLRLPLPLQDATLADLRVVPIGPSDRNVEFRVQPGRLDARVDATAGAIELGFDATFVARPARRRPGPHVLEPSDFELYTAPNEGLIHVTPRVRTLADSLQPASPDAEASIRAFWTHLVEMLNCGVLHYHELAGANAIDWAIDARWVDCQVASALLVSLCRARRIPARLVSGYLLYAYDTSYHYWAEVWFDDAGWLPMDFIASDLSRRGRDIAWRDCFFGQLDYRMKTQCLPRLFTHNPAMPFPAVWHMLSRADGAATEIAFYATDTGALFYRDTVTAERIGAA